MSLTLPVPKVSTVIEVGSAILSELDLESVLTSVVEAAREITAAEYAALGVLNPERTELERFIYLGIDDETKRTIGSLPRGRGVLGELIREPVPLRLGDVNEHPHAYGFPAGHPPMHSFLGVPIAVRGEIFGNLYMTEKRGGQEFDADDEVAAMTLATWAGIAIENARLYTTLSEREAEVERALRRAETSVEIARTAGEIPEAVEQLTIPTEDAVFEAAMQERVAQHLERGTPPSEARLRERLGAEAALVVPLLFRGRAMGVLVALDREAGGADFDTEDLRLLQAFASSAATAVATAQTVESERLQQQVEIGERERRRWAQELHDDALQGLAAIRISLATALQREGPDRAELVEVAAGEAIGSLAGQIDELNRLINDLRPASLERLGLAGALEALAEETSARGDFEIEVEVEIGEQLGKEEERAVFRLVQEALNNVLKHAGAGSVVVSAWLVDHQVQIAVRDDGRGFNPAAVAAGRGLLGMRERVELLGGEIEVGSEPEGGTRVTARIPIERS